MTKIALATALILGTASAAFAQGEADPNLFNRYPAFNMTKSTAAPALTSRNVALGGGQVVISNGTRQNWQDRASFSTGQ